MIFNPRDEVEGMVGRKNIKYEEPFLHKVCSILLTKKVVIKSRQRKKMRQRMKLYMKKLGMLESKL